MAPTPCACPRCSCVVAPDKAVIRNNLSYCCVACANGHPNHEPCHGEDRGTCGCSCGS
ncbi:metallothionein [Cyanobium sp. FGCU-52]|nr:metallothionein [Cyanobium sp. FGCU52]